MEESAREDWACIVPEPMLRRLMAAPNNSVYKAALPGEKAEA